jgi:hypothetical protein
MVRGLLASVLLLAPAAGRADVFTGGIKETEICPGLGVDYLFEDFSLDIVTGSNVGLLTILGGGAEVITDWHVDGRWGYFSASIADPVVGALTLYGWIRGAKMKGWLIQHDYISGCILYGKLKAWR